MLALRKPEPTMMKASASQKTLMVGIVLPAVALDRHQEMADGEQHAAEQHRLALAEVAVGEIAAEHRGDVDEAGIGAVDQVRFAVGEQPMLGEVEDQQRPHAVIGEALPHFGEEEHVEALGMPQEFRLAVGRDESADGEEQGEHCECDSGDPVTFHPQGNVLESGHGPPSRCSAPYWPRFAAAH